MASSLDKANLRTMVILYLSVRLTRGGGDIQIDSDGESGQGGREIEREREMVSGLSTIVTSTLYLRSPRRANFRRRSCACAGVCMWVRACGCACVCEV